MVLLSCRGASVATSLGVNSMYGSLPIGPYQMRSQRRLKVAFSLGATKTLEHIIVAGTFTPFIYPEFPNRL